MCQRIERPNTGQRVHLVIQGNHKTSQKSRVILRVDGEVRLQGPSISIPTPKSSIANLYVSIRVNM